ncbi:MAG: pilus assembly protein PilM [Candidatus Hydrogenedentes bacterium]|nr:pilus assembly protein PilM [Candidatus Hydrogenedentota bacterium]
MIARAKIAAIELNGDDVRVAVVKTGGRLPAVVELVGGRAVYVAPEERTQALARTVEEVLDKLKSKPSACVLCASSLYTIVRQLSIPFRGRRRVAAAVPFELEPHLAFPLDDLLLDYNVIAEVEGETEVLALGMRRSHLEEQIGILEQCGVEVEAVNVDSVALTGLWQAQSRAMKGLNAVLHLRQDSASLAITYKRTLAYIRPLSTNAAQFLENPAGAARDIQNTIRAFLAKWRGEGEISALHLTGVTLTAEDKEAFSQALRLPVEDVLLLPHLKGSIQALAGVGEDHAPNTWEPAIGAAAAAAGLGYALDFRRSERDWRGSLRSVVSHAMLSACLALLILIGVAFYFHQGAMTFQMQSAQYQGEVDALKTELESLSNQGLGTDINIEYFQDPPLLDLMREISQRVPGDKVTITEIEVKPPAARSAWVTIQGEASNAAAVTEVYGKLQGSTLFRAIQDPNVEVTGDKTHFTIKLDRPEEETDELPEA